MPINYLIQAEVIDLRSDTPPSGESFFVDTNVWFWLAYSWANQTSLTYQVKEYPDYLDKIRNARGTFYRCDLSLAELTHIIERSELEIYNQAHSPAIGRKEYRHNFPTERASVVAEIQSAWGIVKSFSQPLDLHIEDSFTDTALARLVSSSVD